MHSKSTGAAATRTGLAVLPATLRESQGKTKGSASVKGMMVVRGIRLAAAGIASAPRSLAGTRAVAPRCCHCVPVRRAAPGETLACIGGAYAVAPGRALAVAMGCYRLGVLAGIRRSRLAALAALQLNEL